MNKLLIIDGNALIHRAYHALPAFKTKDGFPTNAVYGFASMLHRTVEDFKPTHIIVCFDTAAKTFRDELFKDYRAHRPEVDEDLKRQFPIVREFLNAAGINYVEKDGFEADDLIASVCEKFSDHTHCLILTGDKDIFQLINKKVIVATPFSGDQKLKIYDDEAVINRFGIEPKYIPDFKALAGDPSDNYKGVTGIGPKTATGLIQQFKTVEKLYENIDKVSNTSLKQRLTDGKENALLSKELAVLKKDIEIPLTIEEAVFNEYNDLLEGFFEKYNFKSLARRMIHTHSTEKNTGPKIMATNNKKPNADQQKLF